MARKRMWKEWVVDHIIRTGECPGAVPSFGLPTDRLTQAEFNQGIGAMKKHRHTDCHFVPEILGVAEATKDMQEIKISSEGDYRDRVENLKEDVQEVQKSKKLVKLKENLRLYVDRIQFKANGALSVPSPLLELSNYIDKFFAENE